MRLIPLLLCCAAHTATAADQKTVYLEDGVGTRIEVASLALQEDGSYAVSMTESAFSDHFLSMRPFKCIDGPEKTWCHIPYPYEIHRNISADLTDLEYDFLFVWKGKSEYGINMWNGVYYRLEGTGRTITGTLHEMDMDILSAPPDTGDLRPVTTKDLHQAEADSHWLPTMVIE